MRNKKQIDQHISRLLEKSQRVTFRIHFMIKFLRLRNGCLNAEGNEA